MVMSLDAELARLSQQYNDVVQAANSEFPELTERLSAMFRGDAEQVVRSLQKSISGYDDKTLIEVARQHGQGAALEYVDAVDYGVHV